MEIRTFSMWATLNAETIKNLTFDRVKVAEDKLKLIDMLFPGIKYEATDLREIIDELVIPILKKGFPDLIDFTGMAIDFEAITEVTSVLPSNGYEWDRSKKWKRKFDRIIASAGSVR